MVGCVNGRFNMKMYVDINKVYLHRDTVDFRKSIDGLSLIVDQSMNLSTYDPEVFVFCNKRHGKLKILYWDRTGFFLWYKRLEKDRFKWSRKNNQDVIVLDEEQLHWLLDGFYISQIKPHTQLNYCSGI